MASKNEIVNAVLKGLGRRPTSFLLRWSPTLKNLLRFDLVEVSKCEADGGIVTPTMPQSSRAQHAGHKMVTPRYYSLWEVFKVQLRWIS